jgi:hypothetical protein
MATFANRIVDLIGSDYSTIASNSQYDLFNSAVAEVADMLPTELLLKYAVDPVDLNNSTPTWTSVEGKKVLLVIRLEGSGLPGRECKVVSIQDFERTKDANSIYLATIHTPVFSYATDAGNTVLTIYPTPTATNTAKVYYFEYPTLSDLAVSVIAGFPNEVEQAVVLKACINILQAYISDFCQDEEDQEMLQMLGGQVQSLQTQFQGEMGRFVEQDATPRGE